MAFTEDLTAFFGTNDFAVAATYKNGSSALESTVSVIIDRSYLEQFGVASNTSAALGKASDFDGWNDSDMLTVSGTVYFINNAELLDDGAVVLLRLRQL